MTRKTIILLSLTAIVIAGCTTTERRVEHHHVTIAPITIEPIKVNVDATVRLEAAPPAP